ncbi:hypothetical protein H9Y05_14360 [Crocinitomicaceae bacterium CZZ-1]|uniref:Uncharacterized protein n=1 Tax=Taishania pollutisoli TaxID=2766479 RepID=A0A8J6PFS6_9FLAO|nr:hypothetical protein [Taishania pollutisoli]MBC9813655.1 hypothetical protein [Taishania pollutisoli]MBX2949522.1 hypothetical protein [Crocinitomicaceae bacterium]NGF74601.1 hypothetical protein [Fluviicola sp. SGL-29]
MKKPLYYCLLLLALVPFCSAAQLDSASVNAYFDMTEAQVEGLDSTVNLKVIKTETWINDFDFFGEIVIEFTEISTGYTVYIAKKTKAQILAENLISDNTIRIPGYHIEEQRSYKMRFIIRDYQGNNVLEPEFTLIH